MQGKRKVLLGRRLATEYIESCSEVRIVLDGRGVIRDQVRVRPAVQAASLNGTGLSVQLDERSPIGRDVLPVRVFADGVLQGTDTFVVVDVK